MSDEEILEYFADHDEPVYSAVELGTEWEMTEEGIRQRLNKLTDRGLLETKKPGSSTRVYWLPDSDPQA